MNQDMDAFANEQPASIEPTLQAAGSDKPEEDASAQSREIIELIPINLIDISPSAEEVPRMRPKEWEEFGEDFERNGQRDPITVHRVGERYELVDGRHRLWKTQELGGTHIWARVTQMTAGQAADHSSASALHRRHFTDDQRAMFAAERSKVISKDLRRERAQKAGKAGGRGRPRLPESLVSETTRKLSTTRAEKKSSLELAAKEHNVPERLVAKAAALKRDHPELAKKVFAGDIKIDDANRQALPETQPNAAAKTSPLRQESTPDSNRTEADDSPATQATPTVEHDPLLSDEVAEFEIASDQTTASYEDNRDSVRVVKCEAQESPADVATEFIDCFGPEIAAGIAKETLVAAWDDLAEHVQHELKAILSPLWS